jgi:replication-associated recombination protein RarA
MKLMKELGYGEDYKYSHRLQQQFCRTRIFTEALQNLIYVPGNNQRKQH